MNTFCFLFWEEFRPMGKKKKNGEEKTKSFGEEKTFLFTVLIFPHPGNFFPRWGKIRKEITQNNSFMAKKLPYSQKNMQVVEKHFTTRKTEPDIIVNTEESTTEKFSRFFGVKTEKTVEMCRKFSTSDEKRREKSKKNEEKTRKIEKRQDFVTILVVLNPAAAPGKSLWSETTKWCPTRPGRTLNGWVGLADWRWVKRCSMRRESIPSPCRRRSPALTSPTGGIPLRHWPLPAGLWSAWWVHPPWRPGRCSDRMDRSWTTKSKFSTNETNTEW